MLCVGFKFRWLIRFTYTNRFLIRHFIKMENKSVAESNICSFKKRDHSVSSSDEESSGSVKTSSVNVPDLPKTNDPPKKSAKKQKLLTSFTIMNTKKPPINNDESGNEPAISNKCNLHLSETEKLSKEGNKWNIKISSWNVAGIRAWVKKKGLDYIKKENPDIISLQEVKCPDNKLPLEVNIPGYHIYWIDSQKSGYAGVALYSKIKPISVKKGLGIKDHDSEGRVITAEYEQFYLVGVYVPNAGNKLKTLPKRLKWDKDFLEFLCSLNNKKPVILSGDLNVAHESIDLARPDTNTKSAGFTIEEREGMTNLLNSGFIDSFRYLYPDVTGAYTFWAFFNNARARNTGWRIDYFVISESLLPKLCDSVIRKDVLGSDHCPITLYLSL